jgi:hypothetical protein
MSFYVVSIVEKGRRSCRVIVNAALVGKHTTWWRLFVGSSGTNCFMVSDFELVLHARPVLVIPGGRIGTRFVGVVTAVVCITCKILTGSFGAKCSSRSRWL